jgi:LCP family protein required for cell wall assembly
MTKPQKAILAFLSFVACALVGTTGYILFTRYQAFASKPLGPALPVAQQTLPPLWTATPDTPSTNKIKIAPTISIATKTPVPLCGGPNVMTVLAIGQDQRSNNYQYGLGDIVRVVRLDFATPKVTVLEFPRDLWVEIPYISDNLNGLDHGKLNQAYLYGQPGDGFHYWDDPSQGPGLLSETLKLNFGVQADHYIAVNMRTFEKVIDAIDGVTINVPDLETAYNTGLKIGKHHLNGAEALKVARNRKQGMYERVKNQNLVLCAMREKVLSPTIVTQIPALINSFKDNIQTDFTPDQLSQLACLGTKMPVENIAFASFPQNLLKEDVRIFDDPEFPKGLLVTQADFNILRDYVKRFNAGEWPSTAASTSTLATTTTETPAETSSSFCP